MAPKLTDVTPGFVVCGQISVDQVSEIAAQGFRLVINNRPDGEEEGQPQWEQLRHAFATHGIACLHIPIVAGKWNEGAVEAFRDALKTAGDDKVLAFCRSGMRAAAMWVLAANKGRRADAMAAVADAGIDLSRLSGLGAV